MTVATAPAVNTLVHAREALLLSREGVPVTPFLSFAMVVVHKEPLHRVYIASWFSLAVGYKIVAWAVTIIIPFVLAYLSHGKIL